MSKKFQDNPRADASACVIFLEKSWKTAEKTQYKIV